MKAVVNHTKESKYWRDVIAYDKQIHGIKTCMITIKKDDLKERLNQ